MAEIDKLFNLMITKKASDLHLSAGTPPFLRIHGEMAPLDMPALENDAIQTLVFEILTERQKRHFVEHWELDCSYSVAGLARFRVNVFMQRRGLGAVFRVIPEKIMSAKELGLPSQITDLINVPRGMVVVTGPTGSGNSTTLAELIHTIYLTRNEHFLTIEDPIEFVNSNHMCLINHREVSSHTKSFCKRSQGRSSRGPGYYSRGRDARPRDNSARHDRG